MELRNPATLAPRFLDRSSLVDPTQPSNSPERVLIVANPHAGASECAARIERLAQLLRHEGFDVSVSMNLDEVVRQANEAFACGQLRAVIAGGGDGTVAEIVNRTPP